MWRGRRKPSVEPWSWPKRRSGAARPTPRWSASAAPPPGRSVLPDDADHHALDQHVALLEAQGLHGGVGRLQTDPAARLAVELLDGGLAAVDQRDDHLPVFRALLAVHHDDVAVHDVFVDHRRALRLERVVGASARQHLVGYGDGLLMHERFDWRAGRHLTQQGDLRRGRGAAWRQDLDRATLVVRPPDVPFALEIGQMLVHRGKRLKAEMLRDLLEARGVPLALDVALQIDEDFALTLGEGHCMLPCELNRW